MPPDMKKTDNPDDMIYVLGGSGHGDDGCGCMQKGRGKGGRNRWRTAVFVLAAVIFSGVSLFVGRRLYFRFEYPRSRPDSEIISGLQHSMPGNPGVEYSEREILGVALRIYALSGLKASFADSLPELGEDVYIVTRNSDYRIENGKNRIIGDYADGGLIRERSTWRAGFMAVVGGNAQIGVGRGGRILRYVLKHEGSFFRQLAIVSAGVRCQSQYILKGKVSRCAYARDVDGNLYYVETVGPETMFGFADALIEYGFADAVYVTGGRQPELFYRDSCGVAHGSYSDDKPHTMVVWRRP